MGYIKAAHVRLLSRQWFPSQKAQQSRRRTKATPSLVSIGSTCIGSRTCLRAPVSTLPQSSSQMSPRLLSLFSLNLRRTVQPDYARVCGQLCTRGKKNQSLVFPNLEMHFGGRVGVAIERTEMLEARHLDLIARGTSFERWATTGCIAWSGIGEVRGSSNWLVKERRKCN